MLRLIQHLLPRALAWRTTVEKTLRRFFEGLSGLPSDASAFIDLAHLDLWPSTTRDLATWEKQFALSSGGSQAERRAKLAVAWAVQGQQSPDYIQRTLHAAGFTTVFVYEWWESGPPYVARDPREHTTQPRFGVYQCEGTSSWQCFAPGPADPLAPHCDKTLANDPGYVVNLDLTRRAPPPIPDDPSRWPYFIYLAGETFPALAPVAKSRIAELKETILRIAPTQQWIVLLIDPVDELEGFGSSAFGGAPFGA